MKPFQEAELRKLPVRTRSYVDIEPAQATAIERGIQQYPDLFVLSLATDNTARVKAFVPAPDDTGIELAVYGNDAPAWCLIAWHVNESTSYSGSMMAESTVRRTVRALIHEITRRQNEKQGSLFAAEMGGF